MECTVNRVGNRFRDQLRLTGHHGRLADLHAIASLGVRRLRYPVLWERVAPNAPDERDWSWSDARLKRIAALGIIPIVGLLHHGSGPSYTNLLSDDFARLFAQYAEAAARRYDWVEDWTPINEPLTTARFSALYGHWYPHARDERSFYVALLNQIDATRAAMAAIRTIIPDARLIQTDDLGATYSTPSLAGIAAYLNDRRWLGWDLLCGKVNAEHPLWHEIARHGLGDRLRAIGDRPCFPNVVGVNHYVTSDRFLDDGLVMQEALPAVGYHDLCAARVLDPPLGGPGKSLRAAWDRYGIPVALAELHLGCTREEQLRWLWQAWRECCALAADGVEVAGFTPWAMFGAVDWSSLLTREDGHYECGVFDVRGAEPRPTALAGEIRKLSADGSAPAPAHPAAAGPGWWQRPERLEHARYRRRGLSSATASHPASAQRPILITGATGTLGRAFAEACTQRGLAHMLTDRATLAIEDPARCADVLLEHRPWLVVNAAGWVKVDDAEARSTECWSANANGPAVLARACAQQGVRFVTFSSDLVFGGERSSYVETDNPNPLNIYGHSKADAEDRVGKAHPEALIVRTAAFFSPYDEHNFAVAVERDLRAGREFFASDAHRVSPTFVPHLVTATLDLAIDGDSGIWHLSNGGGVTWFEFARRIAEELELNARQVHPADKARLGWIAPRPASACLRSVRGTMLPPFDVALTAHCSVRRKIHADRRLSARASC